MPHNPVQIVLGTNEYMKRPDGGGGGGAKDFFEGRDADFIRHKDKLLREVNSVRAKLEGTENGGVGYVKVKLQSTALAKSHRPMDAIFKSTEFPLVGTGNLGEMFFEVTTSSLRQATSAIQRAENEVIRKNRQDRPSVSTVRSEVGAIDSITLPSSSEKRSFSFEQAAEYFSANPAGRYFAIELFVDESSLGPAREYPRVQARAALRSFRRQLENLAAGLTVWASGSEWKHVHITVLGVPERLAASRDFPRVLERIIQVLDDSPLVRQVSLGPVFRHAATRIETASQGRMRLPRPQADMDYPIVGLVDGGVARHRTINQWRAGGIDFMSQPDSERAHGTFIAGLLINGHGFNPDQPLEAEPCKFFDFDLFCEDEDMFAANFEQGFVDMMRQLDTELAAKPSQLRVINMSLTPEQLTDPSSYGWTAALLDELADKHDVIFVLSAGNLEGPLTRARWPTDPTRALQLIASYAYQGQDRVYEPGESARNLTVGALEPFDSDGVTRPARYTRRGPATAAGTKPDFAHVGGCITSALPLVSLAPDGSKAESEGTSFSAPMVAKTLALLDHRIEGTPRREILLALMYHFAQMPENLNHKDLSDLSRDFAGFGIPASTTEMLATDDHSITLIFADTLPPQMELSFDFTWPQPLIANGKSRGDVALTLVYSPPLEWQHKSEFARVNLDAYLRQEEVDAETGEVSFTGRLKQELGKQLERSLVAHGAKWWPVKHYSKSFKRIGGTSNWRLVVDSVTRAGTLFPEDGVNFAVVLTISDPSGDAAVFASMRQALISSGISLQDVRTATRVRT